MKGLLARSRARRDLLLCILFVVLALALAASLDLTERWIEWAEAFERWEIDELPLGLALGALALGWFSFRRWNEAVRDRDQLQNVKVKLSQEVEAGLLADRELRTQIERFAAATHSARLGYFVWDLVADRCIYCSEEYARLHGLSVEEYMSESAELKADSRLVHPDDRDFYLRSADVSLEQQEPLAIEYRIITKDGKIRHIREIEHKFVIENGRPVRSEGTVQDITDLKRSETLLLHAMNASNTDYAIFDPEDRLVLASEGFKTLFGPRSVRVTTGMAYETLVRETAERGSVKGQPEQVEAWLEARLRRRQAPAKGLQIQSVEGAWLEANDFVFDDGYVFTMISDITERKAMEARLQEAQRMQAVGQLTAGLAHDFNNLLGVIQGNAELLGEKEKTDRDLVESILRSSQRGAELTHRLLAFSRQQPLRPETVSLTHFLEGMTPQLQRTMGDAIEVESQLESDLWTVKADPGQLEGTLLNLALNARKAMPTGGKLSIGCSNHGPEACLDDKDLTESDYVKIEVSDNGIGMDPEVLSRAFEPFFTTDGAMQSSGLGLSMVYGFAKQSGGRITLQSTAGQGTRATLLLPRASADRAERLPPKNDNEDEVPQGEDELILLVDDNKAIRKMVRAQLRSLGYRTCEAADATEAKSVLAQEAVDLALVDIVLADSTTGPALVAEVRDEHPDLEVIFMSGYSEEMADLDPGNRLLTKPFRRRDLAMAVRAALD